MWQGERDKLSSLQLQVSRSCVFTKYKQAGVDYF